MKNFYKEAGLATYGDWAVLNRRYLAIIKIVNLKDGNTKAVKGAIGTRNLGTTDGVTYA